MSHTMSKIYNKFTNGDPITDEELEVGTIFFHDLWIQLNQAGSVFKLAANEAGRVYFQLDSYKRARNER